MTAGWTQWEGRVVNGTYPLRRFLNASDHSAVFLTESTTEGFLNAAIKLVPASPEQAAVQLWHWKTAATFHHPHLMQLLDWGQCEIEGRKYLFVVMEYAEENLSQILPVRALDPDEVRELLVPTLDVLAFLHQDNWVQGQLRPSNFMVVNDHLKLAADTIRPAGVSREPSTRPTIYDSPEAQRGEISSAADIWALGVTLVEALTQYPPTWLNGPAEPPSFPTNLPPAFLDIVQRCLSVEPAARPTVEELQEQTRPANGAPRATQAPQMDPAARAQQPAAPPASTRPDSAAPVSASPASTSSGAGAAGATVAGPASAISATTARASATSTAGPVASAGAISAAAVSAVSADPVMRATPSGQFELEPESARRKLVTPAIAALVVLIAVWGGSHFLRKSGTPEATPGAAAPATASPTAPAAAPPDESTGAPAPAESIAAQQAPAPEAPNPEGAPRKQLSADTSASAVVHEEIPNVPQSARRTIKGHVKVSVRVTVDSSGKVVDDTFADPGPSRYFSRVASQAARKWKFTAADSESSRQWLLRFEFGREGTTVRATRSRS